MPNRLIEDILPLTDLNQVGQKGGGIGSLNAMHPYFARQPLTASRAMTLATLIDDIERGAARNRTMAHFNLSACQPTACYAAPPANGQHKPPRRLRGKPLCQQARPKARFTFAGTR